MLVREITMKIWVKRKENLKAYCLHNVVINGESLQFESCQSSPTKKNVSYKLWIGIQHIYCTGKID